MSDEARRPIRAGQAFLGAIEDDPESQAALRRVQKKLQAFFCVAVREVIGPMNAAQNAAFVASREPLRVYRDMGAALGNAMGGDFEKLRALADAYPDLKEAAGDLEQALLAMKETDGRRLADVATRFERVLPALEDLMTRRAPPAFDDQAFWSAVRPLGEPLEQAGNRAPAGAGGKRRRVNRAVAEQQIMEHLIRRPYDTVEEVCRAVGCSEGLVAESPAWKANRRRLKAAKELQAKTGKHVDPIALDLRDFLSSAGDNRYSQLHEHRRAQEVIDAEIDARDRELYRLIAEYEQRHPRATPQQVARAVGCTAGDVERRRLQLDKLVQAQAGDAAKRKLFKRV